MLMSNMSFHSHFQSTSKRHFQSCQQSSMLAAGWQTVLWNPLQPFPRGLMTHAKSTAQWLRLGFHSWFHVWVKSTWQHIIRTKRLALNKNYSKWIDVISKIQIAIMNRAVKLVRTFCNYSNAKPCTGKHVIHLLWFIRTALWVQWLWTQKRHCSREL